MSWDILSIVFSGIALAVSGWTLWATLLKKGTVKMTRPTTVFFGPDSSPNGNRSKIYLRFLLYSTSRRGRVIESMFVRLKSSEATQTFPIWVYGNKDLARGSGIFVGPEGVAANHHFLLPEGTATFNFSAGNNSIEIVAHLVGDQSEISLSKISVNVTDEQAQKLLNEDAGLHFDWGGEHKAYVGWIDTKPGQASLPSMLSEKLEFINRENKNKTS